jgi:hypothetical protein
MTVKKKCITITEEQDIKVRAIQMRRMTHEKKTVSYSSVLQQAIDEGLKLIR